MTACLRHCQLLAVPCSENNCWHVPLIPARGGSVSAFSRGQSSWHTRGQTHTQTHIPKFVGLFTRTKHLHANLFTARSYVYMYIYIRKKKKSHLKVTSHWHLFMPFIFCCAFFCLYQFFLFLWLCISCVLRAQGYKARTPKIFFSTFCSSNIRACTTRIFLYFFLFHIFLLFLKAILSWDWCARAPWAHTLHKRHVWSHLQAQFVRLRGGKI